MYLGSLIVILSFNHRIKLSGSNTIKFFYLKELESLKRLGLFFLQNFSGLIVFKNNNKHNNKTPRGISFLALKEESNDLRWIWALILRIVVQAVCFGIPSIHVELPSPADRLGRSLCPCFKEHTCCFPGHDASARQTLEVKIPLSLAGSELRCSSNV